jgi:hypothetical protein
MRRLRTFGRRRSGRRVLQHNRANPPARSRSRGGGQGSPFHARAAKSLRRCGHCALLPAGSPTAAGAAWAASNGTGTQGAGVNVLVFQKLLRSLCNWKGPLSVVGLSAAISSTAPQPAASTVIARNPRDDDSVVGDRVADQRPMGLLGERGQGAKDDAGGAPNSRRLQLGGRQRELIVHRAAEGRQRMRLSVLTAAAHKS